MVRRGERCFVGFSRLRIERTVVDGFIESEAAEQPVPRELLEIVRGCCWIDEARQRGGVWRDHQFVGQPPSQTEARHTERAVLILTGAVSERVCRLRDTPRHASLAAVLDLSEHTGTAALIQQRAGERAHQQQRHQVLEHRPAPGHQRGAAVDARDQTAEVEPVMLRHVAFGDGDEARQTRFGCEQVVERVVESTRTFCIRESIPDGEDPPAAVVQHLETHVVGQSRGAFRDRQQSVVRHVGDRFQRLHAGDCRAAPERDVGVVNSRRQVSQRCS